MPHPRPLRATCTVAVLALSSFAAMSCSSPSPAPTAAASGASDAPASGGATPSASGSTTPAPSKGPKTISLAFAGDVHFERQVAALLNDSEAKWSRRLPELAKADFSMVNLETAITTRGTPEPKTYTFRAPAKALNLLKAAGVDAVASANNHAADFGPVGIQDTLAAKAAGTLPMVGFGRNVDEAFTPLTVDIKGVNTAVLASTQIMDRTATVHAATKDRPGVATNGDRTRLIEATRKAAADHDLVVVYLHWGTEGSTCPDDQQRATAQALEKAGADIIVGTHAHRTQGYGHEGRSFVGYGLGNYVWYNTSPSSRPSAVLTVTVNADAARKRGETHQNTKTPLVFASWWKPKYISYNGVPSEAQGSTYDMLNKLNEAAQGCTGLRGPRASG